MKDWSSFQCISLENKRSPEVTKYFSESGLYPAIALEEGLLITTYFSPISISLLNWTLPLACNNLVLLVPSRFLTSGQHVWGNWWCIVEVVHPVVVKVVNPISNARAQKFSVWYWAICVVAFQINAYLLNVDETPIEGTRRTQSSMHST